MKVAKITAELAANLIGENANPAIKFNPVQDADGNWIISLLEAKSLQPEQYEEIDFKSAN